jgi:hypothetical protein
MPVSRAMTDKPPPNPVVWTISVAHLLRLSKGLDVIYEQKGNHEARSALLARTIPMVAPMKKKTTGRSALAPGQTVRLAVHLSRDAKRELEELRVRSLDKKGIKPTHSEIIEELIHEALSKEEIPYPPP